MIFRKDFADLVAQLGGGKAENSDSAGACLFMETLFSFEERVFFCLEN